MGVALYLVLSTRSKNKTKSLVVFFIQLFFNFIWSWIFFCWHEIGLALLDIGFLWLFVFFTILWFFKVSKVAAYLLFPYIIWISFAFYLNLFIYFNN